MCEMSWFENECNTSEINIRSRNPLFFHFMHQSHSILICGASDAILFYWHVSQLIFALGQQTKHRDRHLAGKYTTIAPVERDGHARQIHRQRKWLATRCVALVVFPTQTRRQRLTRRHQNLRQTYGIRRVATVVQWKERFASMLSSRQLAAVAGVRRDLIFYFM